MKQEKLALIHQEIEDALTQVDEMETALKTKPEEVDLPLKFKHLAEKVTQLEQSLREEGLL